MIKLRSAGQTNLYIVTYWIPSRRKGDVWWRALSLCSWSRVSAIRCMATFTVLRFIEDQIQLDEKKLAEAGAPCGGARKLSQTWLR